MPPMDINTLRNIIRSTLRTRTQPSSTYASQRACCMRYINIRTHSVSSSRRRQTCFAKTQNRGRIHAAEIVSSILSRCAPAVRCKIRHPVLFDAHPIPETSLVVTRLRSHWDLTSLAHAENNSPRDGGVPSKLVQGSTVCFIAR